MTYKVYLNCQDNFSNVNRASQQQFNFTKFKHNLEGIVGGNQPPTTATAIVRDIQRFFETVAHAGSNFTSTHLLNLKVIMKYYHHLKTTNRFKSTTNAEKLRRLKMAIKYINKKDNEVNDNDENAREIDNGDNLDDQDLTHLGQEPEDEIIVNAADTDCIVLLMKVSEPLEIFPSWQMT